MRLPHSKRKKALIIVDVQPEFINNRNKYVIKNILDLIKKEEYSLYVEAIFHAEKGSIWDKQTKWTLPISPKYHIIKEIKQALANKNVISTEKTTKSVFKGTPSILNNLKDNNIKEIHIAGLETNDCVLATAYEAFDLGFFTYVLEECCESQSKICHEIGIKALREQNLTNNSHIEKNGKAKNSLSH